MADDAKQMPWETAPPPAPSAEGSVKPWETQAPPAPEAVKKAEPGMVDSAINALAKSSGPGSVFFKGAKLLRDHSDAVDKIVKYPIGLMETGLAGAAGLAKGDSTVVTPDTVVQALKGNAPAAEEYLARLGVPESGSLTVDGHTITGRQAMGFGADVLSTMGVAGAAKRLPGISDILNFSFANKKPGAKEIGEAAKRLGIEATPGMTSGSPTVQGLESSLNQSPTIAGHLVNQNVRPVQTGLQTAANDIVSDAGNMSAGQAGSSMGNSVTADLGAQHANVQLAYEPFNRELPKMAPIEADQLKTGNKILKIAGNHVGLDSSNVESLAKKLSNQISEATNLEEIETLRKQVASEAHAAFNGGNPNAGHTLSKMEDALSDFRDDQFVKIAKQNYPGVGGKNIGEQMVQEYQHAQGLHGSMMTDLKEVGDLLGIKNKNPRSFIEAVSRISPEKMAEKLFKTKSVEDLAKAQKYFPEAFEEARKLKISQIKEAATAVDRVSGQEVIDPGALMRNLDKLSPEVKGILFGPKAQTIADMKTVMNSLPAKIGPSGTPQGNAFAHSFTQEGLDALNMLKYKGLSSPGLQNAGLGFVAATSLNASPRPKMSTTIKPTFDMRMSKSASK